MKKRPNQRSLRSAFLSTIIEIEERADTATVRGSLFFDYSRIRFFVKQDRAGDFPGNGGKLFLRSRFPYNRRTGCGMKRILNKK